MALRGWHPRPVSLINSRTMRRTCTAIQLLRRRTTAIQPAGMRAAVSLHSHSDRSREKLDFVPGIARRIPVVAAFFARAMNTYRQLHGRDLDFNSVYWRPPLSPTRVIASEREQIERRFDCRAMVSLTDHDTTEGPRALRASGQRSVPLSFEWSVPFDGAMFHLGVHGIPPASLDAVERALADYTAGVTANVGELLSWLAESAETFVVLNHPYWDLAEIGGRRHDSTLLAFLRMHGDHIHALELNGYRSWSENRRVMPLAEGFGLPVVGGGDRHGATPNGIINLTSATSFGEFAHELRVRRTAYCAVLPEYCDPFASRVMETAVDALRHLPDHHIGWRHWSERVFMTIDDVEHSLHSMWKSAPWWLNTTVAITRVLGSPSLRPLFELTRADGHRTLAADCVAEPVRDEVMLQRRGSPAVV